MLIEQLTHERGSAPRGGQNEDVGSLAGIIGGWRWGVGDHLVTASIRAVKRLLALCCEVLEAAVDSGARGCQTHRAQQAQGLGWEGADGRVLDSYGG